MPVGTHSAHIISARLCLLELQQPTKTARSRNVSPERHQIYYYQHFWPIFAHNGGTITSAEHIYEWVSPRSCERRQKETNTIYAINLIDLPLSTFNFCASINRHLISSHLCSHDGNNSLYGYTYAVRVETFSAIIFISTRWQWLIKTKIYLLLLSQHIARTIHYIRRSYPFSFEHKIVGVQDRKMPSRYRYHNTTSVTLQLKAENG